MFALILCEKCITRLKNRGELLLVIGDVNDSKAVCDICDTPHELYEVDFPEDDTLNIL